MRKVVLYGNGATALGTHVRLTNDSPYSVAGFTVDEAYIKEDILHDLPVVPFSEVQSVFPPEDYDMMIAVGYVRVNQLRAERYYQAKEIGYRFISYISSKAIVPPGLITGENCMIGAGTLIESFAEIKNNVIIGPYCIIGHDSIINDHCFFSGRVSIAGRVTVGPNCFFGIGATVRNRVVIAKETVVGAGALILGDTKEKEVYMGRAAELLPISSDQLTIG